MKIGGRLVENADLGRIAHRVLDRRERPVVFVAGGGRSADLVREWNLRLALGDEDAHWLAVRAMTLQSELLARRLRLPCVDRFEDSCRHPASVIDLYSELHAAGADVPTGWHVTSDSLAAWAARKLGAANLILVKSVGGADTDLATAASLGWVDENFRAASTGLSLEWVNGLRISGETMCISGVAR